MDGDGEKHNHLMVSFEPDMFTDYQESYLEGVYQFMRILMEKLRNRFHSKLATSLLFCDYLLKTVFWRGDFSKLPERVVQERKFKTLRVGKLTPGLNVRTETGDDFSPF